MFQVHSYMVIIHICYFYNRHICIVRLFSIIRIFQIIFHYINCSISDIDKILTIVTYVYSKPLLLVAPYFNWDLEIKKREI